MDPLLSVWEARGVSASAPQFPKSPVGLVDRKFQGVPPEGLLP
jgi:hypothetical protein